MHDSRWSSLHPLRSFCPGKRSWLHCLTVLALLNLSGCAAITNPVADGVPVRLIPPELLAAPKKNDVTIPLTFLGQQPQVVYRLAPGDVLGVYIPGVLGDERQAPPNSLAPQIYRADQYRLTPGVGFPVPIPVDGKIRLPQVPPIDVLGLTVTEAQEKVRRVYVDNEHILNRAAIVVVTLLNQREYRVVVMRQESGNISISPRGGIGGGKRGTGQVIDLLAGENDVLHALSQSGGLPGLDAFDEVVIERGGFLVGPDGPPHQAQSHEFQLSPTPVGPIVHIPLRMKPGEKPHFRPEDVILQNGDVVFVEARDADVFYTGGLLPSGQFIVPRDYDLDVVDAIAQVQGALINGAFATSNLAGTLLAPGIGSPSPALLTVIRRTPTGAIPIRVDLERALRDPRERILVRAGDVLILQERPQDAFARYVTQTFLNFSLSWQVIHDRFITGVLDASAPNQIPARIQVGNIVTQ